MPQPGSRGVVSQGGTSRPGLVQNMIVCRGSGLLGMAYRLDLGAQAETVKMATCNEQARR
jgi:hypothetical protein